MADTLEDLEVHFPIASHNHTKGNRNMLQPMDLRVNQPESRDKGSEADKVPERHFSF